MPTLDPVRELISFAKSVDSSMSRYRRLHEAVAEAQDSADLRKSIAVDAAFRLGAEWESVQHRWFVAAIARDSQKLINLTRSAVDKKVEAVSPAAQELFAVMVTRQPERRQLTGAQIERLLDPELRNITFGTVDEWLKESNKYLAPMYLRKVQGLHDTPELSCVAELVKSLRNRIAHGSQTAALRLSAAVRPRQDGIGIEGADNSALVRQSRGVRDIGVYLNGWTGVGLRNSPETTRVALLHSRMRDVAAQMA